MTVRIQGANAFVRDSLLLADSLGGRKLALPTVLGLITVDADFAFAIFGVIQADFLRLFTFLAGINVDGVFDDTALGKES